MHSTVPDYYNRVNLDLLSAIKPNQARILEIKLVESAGLTVESVIPRLIPMHQQAYNDYIQFLLPLVKVIGVDSDEFARDAMSVQYVVTAGR